MPPYQNNGSPIGKSRLRGYEEAVRIALYAATAHTVRSSSSQNLAVIKGHNKILFFATVTNKDSG